jgi:hypothetical protein
MEPLWSPAVATGSNRWQMGGRPERLKQAKTVAVGCDRLPEPFHGKEGVDGSSPSEGSCKSPHTRGFHFLDLLHLVQFAQVWNRFWNTQTKKPLVLSSSVTTNQRPPSW